MTDGEGFGRPSDEAAKGRSLPIRRSARVLLLNPADEILLFHCFDEIPVDPARENTPYWVTVGGGVEPGETLEQCARREVREETGIVDVDLDGPVWRLERVLHLQRVPTWCDETYFVGRTRQTHVDRSGMLEAEAACTLGSRWWSLEAICASSEVFLPEGIVPLIERVLGERG